MASSAPPLDPSASSSCPDGNFPKLQQVLLYSFCARWLGADKATVSFDLFISLFVVTNLKNLLSPVWAKFHARGLLGKKQLAFISLRNVGDIIFSSYASLSKLLNLLTFFKECKI